MKQTLLTTIKNNSLQWIHHSTNSISHSYRVSLATWDHMHSVTYHQTQVNTTPPSHGLVLDLPTPTGWKAELTIQSIGLLT